MKNFGLIGYPLTHSFSKKYYTEKFEKEGIANCNYDLYSIESIKEFPELIAKRNLDGINVTIPYKKEVIPYLDDISEEAAKINAVNCIRIIKSNGQRRLKGYNTDILGFKNSLSPLLEPHHRSALILGNGGAAQAVKHGLKDLNIEYTIISRTPKSDSEYSYKDLNKEIMQMHSIIINCSPVGTFPNINKRPDIPYEYSTGGHLFYDLIYNPSETLFLKTAKEYGAQIKNGYEMLVLQAEENWKIWNEV